MLMRVTLILLHSLLQSFLKNLKLIFFITHFLLNPFPSLDGYTGIDLALCLFMSLIIFIDHSCHSISYHCLFLFYLYPTVSENKWSTAWCSTFTGTLNQPLFHRFNFIFISFSSHFGFNYSSHVSWGIYYYTKFTHAHAKYIYQHISSFNQTTIKQYW
jgi:hypothetical protein